MNCWLKWKTTLYVYTISKKSSFDVFMMVQIFLGNAQSFPAVNACCQTHNQRSNSSFACCLELFIYYVHNEWELETLIVFMSHAEKTKGSLTLTAISGAISQFVSVNNINSSAEKWYDFLMTAAIFLPESFHSWDEVKILTRGSDCKCDLTGLCDQSSRIDLNNLCS